MQQWPQRLVCRFAVLAVAGVVVVSCSSDDNAVNKNSPMSGFSHTTVDTVDQAFVDEYGTTAWLTSNKGRVSYDREHNAIAMSVANMVDEAVECKRYADTAWGGADISYLRYGLPVPLGSGSCEGGMAKENILIEVFGGSPPNADDFVAAKRKLICQRALDLGRESDGTQSFDGIPYVVNADKTWLIQPDSIEVAKTVAEKLGLVAGNMCAGMK